MADKGRRGHRNHGGGAGAGGGGGGRRGGGGKGNQGTGGAGYAGMESAIGAMALQDQPIRAPAYEPSLPETLVSYGDVLRITKKPDSGGKRGAPIALEANHFRFELKGDVVVQQYDVTLTRFDLSGKARKANLDESHLLFWHLVRLHQDSFGSPEQIVYDRRKQMYTMKLLDETKNGQTWKLREKSVLRKDKDKNVYFTCEIKHVSAIHVNDVKQIYNENLNERERQHIHFLELLFRQGRYFNDQLVPAGRSFYMRSHHPNKIDLGCGRELLRGFYLSTRLIDNWRLSLNVNWNMTAFYDAGELVKFAAKFLVKTRTGQEYNPAMGMPPSLDADDIRLLRGELRDVKLTARHIDQTFKLTSIAPETARTHEFHWQERDTDHGHVTVEEYFKLRYNMQLKYPGWPLIQRGKGKNIRFMPMELCDIADGQRVKNKDISDDQRRTCVLRTAVSPAERRQNILNMLKEAQLTSDPRLRQFYISMSMEMAQVTGRVLPAPKLQYTGSEVQPQSGQWNGGKLFKGAKLENWGFVNFSRNSDDDIRNFANLLYQEGRKMGMDINPPYTDEIWTVRARFNEQQEKTRNVLQTIKREFDAAQCPLQLIVIILDKKAADGPYNEIKRYSEGELGIMTQCLQTDRVFNVSSRARDTRKGLQALSNIILKINAKLGGVNVQISRSDPVALKYLFQPILFIGADVTHPEPGDQRSPSIAGICGNVDNHPNRYVGIEQVQKSRKEIIVHLKAAVKQLLKEYFVNTGGLKPDKIVFYRDGVSEGQFMEVLMDEERAIEQACMELEATYKPAITFIVVQKRHHTRFFKKQMNPNDKPTMQNIPPGTVVDHTVTHPVEFDFFLCSHQGIQGTSKPTHYHVLFDQTGFTSDELQALTYQLCHTYARCTRSVSIPAPVYYAHHIAFRAKIRSKGYMGEAYSSGSSSTGSGSDAMTPEELMNLQELLSLAEPIKGSMYWQ